MVTLGLYCENVNVHVKRQNKAYQANSVIFSTLSEAKIRSRMTDSDPLNYP